jgi:predicted transposase/invertase (TIGR01784 family)
MSRYLDPTNDIAFKKLFGIEQHKPLLVSFLNAILSLEGSRRIKNVEFLTKEQIPLIKEAKTTILDIKCTDESGKQYIVEIQNRKQPSFIKRTQFYVAHSYVSQAPIGADYMDLKQVILLAIANHELFPNKENVISYHKTLDTQTFEHDLKDMCYVFIELPKFTKTEDELETLQDKWIYFFNNWNKSTHVPAKMQEEELIEAYQSMEEFNWNGAEREAYLKANIALADEFDARRQEREQGREEGLHQGREEGLHKGREEGCNKQKIQDAKAMLKEALSVALISRVTGLREEEVQAFADLEVDV